MLLDRFGLNSCERLFRQRLRCVDDPERSLNLPMDKSRGFRTQSLPTRRCASCVAILSHSRFAPNPWHRHNKQTAYTTHNMSDWLPNLASAKPSCGTIALATLPTIACWRYDMLDTGFFASSSLTPQLKQGDCVAHLFSHKFPANIDLLTLSGCHSLSELEPESLLVLTFHPAQTSVLQSKVNSNGVKIFIYFVESDIYPVEPFINLFKSFINLFKSFIKSCIKPFKHRPHHSDDGNRTSNSRPVHNFSPFEAKILAYQINELQEAAS